MDACNKGVQSGFRRDALHASRPKTTIAKPKPSHTSFAHSPQPSTNTQRYYNNTDTLDPKSPEAKFNWKYRVPSARLTHFDYASGGAYFVTICTKERECFFGDVVNGEVKLSEIGKIAEREWQRIGDMRKNVWLDEWVVMPNHIHGIIVIHGEEASSACSRDVCNASLRMQDAECKMQHTNAFGPQRGNLSSIIRGFKGAVKSYANANGLDGFYWQSRFYDHIIRDEKELHRIREYIAQNPAKWEHDKNNEENMYM